MSVRQSLLAILDQGPCYGYQLRAEFDRRTGSTWPLNVGQIYNTLDRLERDSLVSKGAADAEGHVYWQITAAGSAEVQEWLATPLRRAQTARDELAVKLAVTATLPGVDARAAIRVQREASAARLAELREATYAGEAAGGAEEWAWSLVHDARIVAAEADLTLLDRVEQRLAARPHHTPALELSTQRPKRGRPAHATSA